MAGHSQFKNIMHRKGRQDQKRGKVFSRLSREITVAARLGGEDPAGNPRLRLAIQEARGHNMPKDNIERAIQKAVGGGGEEYAEVCYEGYGPGGVGYMVEALTDNRNRTASSLRAKFDKSGGSLAEGGAVRFQFERVGEILFDGVAGDEETVFLAASETGARDVESSEAGHRILCEPSDVASVAAVLEEALGAPPARARQVWSPTHTVTVDGEVASRVLRLYETLGDDDDVQEVFANFDLPDDLLEELVT